MKTGEALQTSRLLFIVKCGILTLLMSALFAMPIITPAAYAFGHTIHYNAFAMLAEKDVKMKELQAQKEKRTMTTTVTIQNEADNAQAPAGKRTHPYGAANAEFTIR